MKTPDLEPLAEPLFERAETRIGRLWLRRLQIPADMAVVHSWVTQPHARYWGLVGRSLDDVCGAYLEIARHSEVYLGYHADEPAFLLECYAPTGSPLAEHYDVEQGDRGMHLLLAPCAVPLAGFSSAVFTFVMDYLFSDATTRRIVVEPDIRNHKIHVLNRSAGFRYRKPIAFPHKTAHLALCTREQYLAATRGEASELARSSTQHLEPGAWQAANRGLIRKAIAEFAHERLIEPRLEVESGEWGQYRVSVDAVAYTFRARRLELDHWDIQPGSLLKTQRGAPAPLDACDFILDFRAQLGIADEMLPVYLEEIASTLYAAAFKHAHQRWSAADLVHATFQDIEGAMQEGHPCFVANSGRVGFDAADYLAYAPEAAAPVQLVWIAVRRRHAEFTCAYDLSYERLLEEELGAETLARFETVLRDAGLAPQDYLLMPTHPWQWFNKLALVFAPDIAHRDLVCLGYGDDQYRAQQSIRTFFNVSHPHKRYVKTALSVLNMGFMRGLSADYMRATPPINDWIAELISADPCFREYGFSILREVAGIGYRNPYFEAALPKTSPYRKMLAALWRESPLPQLAPGERLMTMAALLHRDRDGYALLPQLIAASGLDVDAWLDQYLRCYLAPLLHCLVRYDLAFMPHGENVILVVRGNVPVRALLKDIAEEAVLMDGERRLPERVQRICVAIPQSLKALSIFTDVFDDILRFLAPILLEQAGYTTACFWQRVAACVGEYRRAHPELAAKMAELGLFATEFQRSCLNRLQLTNNQQMVDLTDPSKALQFVGTLDNPVANVGR